MSPEAMKKVRALAKIVLDQCSGFTSGPGFEAAQAAREVHRALDEAAEGGGWRPIAECKDDECFALTNRGVRVDAIRIGTYWYTDIGQMILITPTHYMPNPPPPPKEAEHG